MTLQADLLACETLDEALDVLGIAREGATLDLAAAIERAGNAVLAAVVQLVAVAGGEGAELVRGILAAGSFGVDDIARHVEAALAGDRVAAAEAELLATFLATAAEPSSLDIGVAYLVAAGLAVGLDVREERDPAWVRRAAALLSEPGVTEHLALDDAPWITFAHRVADAAARSAEAHGDAGLFEVGLAILDPLSPIAGNAGFGNGHRRRLAELSIAAVRGGAPVSLLDRALDAAGEAWASASGQNRAAFRDLHARALSLRADITGNATDRKRAVDLWTAAVGEADETGDRALQARLRLNLASELGLSAKDNRDVAAVRIALSLYEEAAGLAPDSSEKGHVLAGAANRHRQLYDMVGVAEDLDRSIKLGDEAIALLAGVPLSIALNNQATRYRRRYEDFGDPADLDRAITTGERAIAGMPGHRRELALWLANLSHHYRLRSARTGDQGDGVRARWHARRAMRKANDGEVHAAFDAHISAELASPRLSDRALTELLTTAESLAVAPAGPHPRAIRLANVALAYAKRFERSGDLGDASAASAKWEEALSLLPAGEIDRVGMLSQAGAGAELMFDASGDASHLVRAIAWHRDAFALSGRYRQRGPVRTSIAVNLANALARHAELVLDRSELDEAVAVAEEACEGAGAAERLAALTALGGARLNRFELDADQQGAARSGDATKAVAAYRDAVASANDERGRASAKANLANALFSIGYSTGDLAMLNEASDLYAEATAGVEAGDVSGALWLTNLGFAALTVAGAEPDPVRRQHQLEVARSAFADAGQSTGAQLDLRTALGRARVAAASGTWAETADAAAAAMASFASAVPSAGASRYAQATLRLAAPLPALGALALARDGRCHDAVAFLESGRGNLLHAELSLNELLAKAEDNSDEFRVLAQEARVLEARVSERPTVDDLARLKAVRAELTGVAAAAPDHRNERGSLSSGIASETTAVLYLVGDDHGGQVLKLHGDGAVEARDCADLRTGVAARWARRLRQASHRLTTSAGQRQFRLTLSNALDELGRSAGPILLDLAADSPHTVLVPVGPLSALPWHAFEVDGAPLGTRTSITYAPTLRLAAAAWGQDPATGAPDAVVAFEPPTGLDSWSMDAEAAVVTAALTAAGRHVDGLRHDAATTLAVSAALARAPIVHVAAHVLERALVSESGIVLADGFLTARRLLAGGIAGSLVFLAACSTSRPLLGDDEPFTLAAAALAAGARSVVATLWPVPDVVGPTVAQEFYAALLDGAGPGDALRQAQGRVAAQPRFEDPFFWAAYTVSGAP